MTNDRRTPSTQAMAKWIALVVGVFSILGVVVGAGISYGQHMRADDERDRDLRKHNEQIDKLEDRVRDLEFANRWSHGDNGLLPHAPKETR